jgi:hypothetical protein
VIARWKGIIEEIHFGGSIMPSAIIENLDLKKPSFRPSKWPRKLKPAKNSKLPKLPENCFEPVGKGGWPPISTWIRSSSRYGKAMQGKERHGKARQGKEMQGMERKGKAWKDKTWHGKSRKGRKRLEMAWNGKTRHGMAWNGKER